MTCMTSTTNTTVPNTSPSTGTGTSSGTAPGSTSASASDAAIAKMEATFDRAIEKSAKITEITTGKKTELDATKQRPQN